MKHKKRRIYYLLTTLMTVAFVFTMVGKVSGMITWKLYDLIGIPSAVYALVILYSKIINQDFEEE